MLMSNPERSFGSCNREDAFLREMALRDRDDSFPRLWPATIWLILTCILVVAIAPTLGAKAYESTSLKSVLVNEAINETSELLSVASGVFVVRVEQVCNQENLAIGSGDKDKQSSVSSAAKSQGLKQANTSASAASTEMVLEVAQQNTTTKQSHEHEWQSFQTILKQGYYATEPKSGTHAMLYVYDASGNQVNQFLPGNRTDAEECAAKVSGSVKEVNVQNTCTVWYSPVYEYGKQCACGESIIEGSRGGTKTVISGHV